jgi:cellulose biosynthesis protein BcsQ
VTSTPPDWGQVITFYSYKGGTGRTMAVANTACLLVDSAEQPGRVLMIDWDLEAPGLHRFFRGLFKHRFAEALDPDVALDTQPGLIDLFVQLDQASHEADGDGEHAAAAALDQVGLEHFIIETDIPSLDLLKAGRFDDQYSTLVNRFDWEALYSRSPWLFRLFAERLTERYRFVLIDSRTGLTDISGICTTLLPERLVLVFTPNRQSLMGVLDLVPRATAYRRASGDLRPLVIFPLPSRIELSEARLRQDWRLGSSAQNIDGYQTMFESAFREAYDLGECDLAAYFDEVQIPHVPRFGYGEEIAVLTERRGDSLSLSRRYESLAHRLIALNAPWEDTGEVRTVPTTVSSGGVIVAQTGGQVVVARPGRSWRDLLTPVLTSVITVLLLFLVGYLLLRPPNIRTFSVEPRTVIAGDTATLSWQVDGAVSITIEPPVAGLPDTSGSATVQPQATTEYTLSGRNWLGVTSAARTRVDVLRITSFRAIPDRLSREGQEVTLHWETVGATSIRVEPGIDIRDPKPSGEAVVRPMSGATYRLIATGLDGTTTEAQVSFTLAPPVILRFEVGPGQTRGRVFPGDPVELLWIADGFTEASLSASGSDVNPGQPTLDVSAGPPSIVQPTIAGDITYTLRVSNAAGSSEQSLRVMVASPGIVQFDVEPPTVVAGQVARLRWRVEGATAATSIFVEPGLGRVDGTGERTIAPTESTLYTLRMINPDGSAAERQLAVTVIQAPPTISIFTAVRSSVSFGEEARLAWSVAGAERIEIRTSDGVPLLSTDRPEGTLVDFPPTPTTYILEARNSSGSARKDFSVDVRPPPGLAPTPGVRATPSP